MSKGFFKFLKFMSDNKLGQKIWKNIWWLFILIMTLIIDKPIEIPEEIVVILKVE